jgi:hypothetical protein
MKRFLLALSFLSITYCQAGMFDQVTSIVSKQLTDTKSDSDFISSITKNINITPTQATSGTAAILEYAKNQVSSKDYTSLIKDIPALGNLNTSSLTESLLNKITTAQSVQTAFKTIGLEPSMIKQFVPLILEYTKKIGSQNSSELLSGALKGLL